MIGYMFYEIVNLCIFVSHLESKKILQSIVKTHDYKMGKKAYQDAILYYDIPPAFEEKNEKVRTIYNRLIIQDVFKYNQKFNMFISKNLNNIEEEVEYISNNIIFIPSCSWFSICQIIIYIVYSLLQNNSKQHYLELHNSAEYCKKIGTNTTIFNQRISIIMTNIWQTNVILSALLLSLE